MKQKNIVYKNKNLKRINKAKAFNIFENPTKYKGLTVYILPVNANPFNAWINGFWEFEIEDVSIMDAQDNINAISEYKYYNCIEDLGNYLKFYIEKE